MFELDICECSGVVLEATHVMVLDCIIIDDCEQLYDHRITKMLLGELQ